MAKKENVHGSSKIASARENMRNFVLKLRLSREKEVVFYENYLTFFFKVCMFVHKKAEIQLNDVKGKKVTRQKCTTHGTPVISIFLIRPSGSTMVVALEKKRKVTLMTVLNFFTFHVVCFNGMMDRKK